MINWSPGTTLEQVEEQVIQKALIHFRGNKTQTAIALGVSIRTIDNKLEKYEIAANENRHMEEQRKIDRAIQLARHRGIQPAHPASNYPILTEKKQEAAIANSPEVTPPEFVEARVKRRG